TRDTDTGLTYLNARYYDPDLAHFISTDPLADQTTPQHANPYGYAAANPITYTDPTGLAPTAAARRAAARRAAAARAAATRRAAAARAAAAKRAAAARARAAATKRAAAARAAAARKASRKSSAAKRFLKGAADGFVLDAAKGVGQAITAGKAAARNPGKAIRAAASAQVRRLSTLQGWDETLSDIMPARRMGKALGDSLVTRFQGGDTAGAAGYALGTAAGFIGPGRAKGALGAGTDVTRIFRVEGPGNARLNISAGGDVSIMGDSMLFLNFGDEARAQEFLAQRLTQGHEGTVIRSFDVLTSYAKDVAARAVPESMARGSSVISVDTTKTASSYGLRSSEFSRLRCAIIPGSGC
ncbi:MAG: filamentous hemagglutinin, partial [Actinomycetota bacterium]|nr:filamentous hemagglutinin [Actinomycetota bacterium]